MALRNQVPESQSTYKDPDRGINLFDSEEDLRPGDARLMQNCIFRSGVRMRNGNTRITASQVAASFGVRGGHRGYYGVATPTKKRLIAYDTKISEISDVGVETVLTSGMTSDKDTYFTTWSITDKTYISNANDTLSAYDGSTHATITGTAIPTPRGKIAPILDRLMCITTDGIERTDPRVDNVWSNDSGWATLRPIRVGPFTTLHPFSLRGTDTVTPGILAFQANGHYLISGTDFGADVTSATASAGENARLDMLDPEVGTSSPDSVVTVPGVGTFWFTTDLNVYWIPEGQLSGVFVGDRIRSNGTTVGIESMNKAQIAQVWMTYFDRFLILGVPMESDSYASTQFWLDLSGFRIVQGSVKLSRLAWYGPMTGQTISRAWREDQQGELNLRGGEGNTAQGVFVYNMMEPGRFQDATGATDTNITMTYQPPFMHVGSPSREHYVRSVNLGLRNFTGTPTLDLLDIDETITSGVSISAV